MNGEQAEAVDRSTLERLLGGEPERVREMLGFFIAPSRKLVDEIQSGVDTRSSSLVAHGAHKLKSSSRSIGASTLGDICAALEKAGKEEDWPVIEQEFTRLGPAMQAVENWIARY